MNDDLVALQRVDTTLDQLAHRRANLAERSTADEAIAAATAADQQLARIAARQQELATAIADAENESSRLDAERDRLNAQMKSVVVLREAEALQHELAEIASKREALDDTELEHLEEESTLSDEAAAIESQRGERDATIAAANDALRSAEADIDEETATLTTTRSELTGRIDAAVLADYESRRAHFGGVAVGTLEGKRCSGCHLDLSTSEFEQVRAAGADRPTDCPQCGRMLVVV